MSQLHRRPGIAAAVSSLVLASLSCAGGAAVARADTESSAAEAVPQVCKPSEYAADTYFPKPAFAGQTRAPAPASRLNYQVETVANGLVHPWSLAFLPDDRMLVTEKAGRLRIVSRSGELSAPLEGVPTLAKFPDGDGGVHDVLLDPQFATNRILYFTTYEIVCHRQVRRTRQRHTTASHKRKAQHHPTIHDRRLHQSSESQRDESSHDLRVQQQSSSIDSIGEDTAE